MAAVKEFSHFDIDAMPRKDSYKLLTSVVMPRPIAWVVSRAEDGSINAAPFSFFNMVCGDPPMLTVSFSPAPERDGKDTLAHIRAKREFVVNLVSEELAEAMNITATNAPRGTDETTLAGLELTPSEVVDVPRIAASPVALECRLFQIIEPGKNAIVMGSIVYAHVISEAFENQEKLYIDPHKLRLIGRMHGAGGYCTTRDIFTIQRKSWPL
jgi:flavin reductase (DIM6/NTAB) family NADH-FMN oxidoreductase RutF